ncbi:MAG: class I SAM-dependent methyltransferase [Planctomycetaceae bacterium]|nr:MAG: class I SAM-dependent methyltransferase [Planctomycetaceae bacterium]
MPPTADSTRFRFGENWKDFLSTIDRDRVEAAAVGLERLLGADTNLAGRSFVDIGCGSGLVSLAAHLAGAQVTSFDFDEQSVRCTETLRERCEPRGTVDSGTAPGPPWRILHGSILDQNFIAGLGRFDIAYAWGVLHHTGRMWPAIEAACDLVAPGGRLVLAIYHDQGGPSRRWARVKRFYHRLPPWLRPVYVASIAAGWELRFSLARLCSGRNPLPLEDWRSKKRDRGMSVWHDWVDWIGGWPFEVSSPDGIINPLIRSGFELRMLKTVGGGWGCNEYVFRRSA